MNLYAQGLNVVRSVRSSREVAQVELDLVPPLIESHGHSADEGFHSGRRLVVGCAEPAAHVLIVEYLHFESEVLLEVLDDHNEERKLDAEGLVGVSGTGDVVSGNVRAHDLENGGLDVGVGNTLDVAIADALIPDLEGLGSKKERLLMLLLLTQWSRGWRGTRTRRCS